MTDEVQNGVRITITVEVVEDGKTLPQKIEQWVLDPTMVGGCLDGLQDRASEALPRACIELMHQLRPQLTLRVCKVCEEYAVTCDEDGQGEHHPACKHAPANPRNAGWRVPAADSDADPV